MTREPRYDRRRSEGPVDLNDKVRWAGREGCRGKGRDELLVRFNYTLKEFELERLMKLHFLFKKIFFSRLGYF